MAGGRPSPIDRVIGTREVDGQTVDVTVADRIVAAIRSGSFVEAAAASAGITKTTFYEWQAVAGRARIRCANNLADMTDHEVRCCQFSDAVAEAEGVWEVGIGQVHESVSRGGIEQTVRTTKYDAAGNVVEVTERTSSTLPDLRGIEWRLTRRFPHRYAPPERIEITGPDGEPITLSMEERASALSELARRVKGAARKAGRSARSVSDDDVGAAPLPVPPDSAPSSPAPPVRKAARTSSPKKAPGAETKAKQRRRARNADDDD